MPDPDLRALLESWIIHLRAERKAEGTVRLVERTTRVDALRAIDSSGRPRSWRTCGPRRLRRQSQPV
jgi:hypothetical protein